MSVLRGPRWALVLCTVSLSLAAVSLVMLATSWSMALPSFLAFRGFAIVFAFEFAILGLFIVWRRRANAIGWTFSYIGVAAGIQAFVEQYATRALLISPGTMPLGEWAAWVYSWIGIPNSLLSAIFLGFLFPHGRIADVRQRAMIWIGVIAILLFSVAVSLLNDQLPPPFSSVVNPLPAGTMRDALFVAGLGALALALVSVLAAAASVVRRSRRATGDERQQFKWFGSAAAMGGIGVVVLWVAMIFYYLRDGIATFEDPPPLLLWLISLSIVSFGLIPAGAAVAILRYRLYDIDLLIRRTLVFGALSGVLLASYAGLVIVFQAALRPFTGGNELAVAGSTLAVVALFQPLRRRIQDLVDRRFYRSHYNAVRTLDLFTARLRDDVDLDSVRTDLLGVVDDTLRPEHASVWLRDAAR